jgi:hypothetical protein
MTKLAALMEWLSLPEAARCLSDNPKDDITEASLLRYGLQGDLTLSFHFVNPTPALLGTIASIDGKRAVGFPLWHEGSRWQWLPPDDATKRPQPPANLTVKFRDEIDWINGAWDLLITEDTRLAVERAFQKMTGGPEVLPGLGDGILVASTDGRLALLQVASERREMHPHHRLNYKLSRDLPAADGALVICGSSLLEFETRLHTMTASEGSDHEPTAPQDIHTNGPAPFLAEEIPAPDPRDDWKKEAWRMKLAWNNFS